MAEIFDVVPRSIQLHIQSIFDDEELDKNRTAKDFFVVQIEGGRSVRRELTHYNIDMIISVGYRVNAKRAVKFRQWASQILKAYLEQGYVINEQVLRGSPDKLNKLAAEIRALRSEEIQVYAKVRECFKISSSDYDSKSKQVQSFYALLQDKFHHAVTGMTSSKLVMDRADHTADNMGIQSIKGDLPTIKEVETGKNYLLPEELYRLHLLSEQFLLYAESTALASKPMTMDSLHIKLDKLLELNDYPVFEGYTDFLRDRAIRHARQELEYFKNRKKIESLGLSYDEEAFKAGDYDYVLDED